MSQYTPSGNPISQSRAIAQTIRNEFALIETAVNSKADALTTSLTDKPTPVDADLLPIADSAASFTLKKLTWANLKATLKTYFDSVTTTLTNKTLTAPVINSPTGIVKGDVGLGNVDNTSDATKNAATATLTNKTLTTPILNNPSYSGTTANGGTVTTIDINGGTIDGTVIGGTTPAAGSFTTVTATNGTLNVIVGPNSISQTTALGDLYVQTPTGRGIYDLVGGATITSVTSTGLSVTGALSATGAGSFTGGLGVGTTSPATYIAQVANYSANYASIFSGYANGSGTFPKVSAIGLGSDAVSFTHTSGGSTYALKGSVQIAAIQSASSDAVTDLAFYTTTGGAVAERARLDASGNFGLGVPPAAAAKLQVKAASNINFAIANQTTITGAVTLEAIDDTRGSNIPMEIRGTQVVITRSAGETARFDASGNFGLGLTPYASVGGNGSQLQIGNPLVSGGAGLTIGSTTTGDIQFSDAASGTGQYAGIIRYSHSDNSMSFWTNSTEKGRIDASGNFGLGVTPKSGGLFWSGFKAFETIGGNSYSATATATYITNNLYWDGAVGWKHYATGEAAQFAFSKTAFTFYLSPSGTADTLATQTSVLSLELGKTVALQGATSAAGTGIAFPATQLASSNANTLDDYEEGTFTAGVSFGGAAVGVTYTATTGQYGLYTKVGNRVFWSCAVRLTSKGSSTGALRITGLPFTSQSAISYNEASVVSYFENFTGLTGALTARVSNTSSVVEITQTAAATCAVVTDAAVTNTTYIVASGSYTV